MDDAGSWHPEQAAPPPAPRSSRQWRGFILPCAALELREAGSPPGLGPFAGVLAIAVSDFGAFGKLFSEAFEGADRRQVEGIRAAGGGRLEEIRFGLVPQVLPVIAGQVLYFIESNVRSATIIGIVGAGGIGLQLAEQIRVLEWQKVSFLILMILVAVAAIDWISNKLRFAIIGRRAIA